MRITDRGPFVEDRMLDLTIASAKAVGVYRAGLAMVRMDVYEAPKPIDAAGAGACRSARSTTRARRWS